MTAPEPLHSYGYSSQIELPMAISCEQDGVRRIERDHCAGYVLNVHYARRWPSISYAYGLFEAGELVGICTFGTPCSSSLRAGIAGQEFTGNVTELNRLCLRDNRKNQASYLVAAAIRLLPDDAIIVSYADMAQGHVGYVYQATNFLYTGLSAKRSEWKIKGLEHLHSMTVADMARGSESRADTLRARFGDDFYIAERPRKHRYIYIKGSKRFRKSALAQLRYPIEPYPKVPVPLIPVSRIPARKPGVVPPIPCVAGQHLSTSATPLPRAGDDCGGGVTTPAAFLETQP